MKKQSWVSNVKPVYSGFSALRNSVLWKCALAVANLTVGIAALINPAFAQSNIVPDNTLGSEASRVIFNSRDTPNEAIEGGAQRGQNLFHSFEEFNVSQNRGAYFHVLDPSIQNIFARVTGSNRSDILGTLGTRRVINGNLERSNANVFFVNPNGIVFGENARLDINGSFYATTANEIQFGNQGNFSTINPQAPRALTVNPSALFFDAVAKQGEIVNRSIGGLEVLSGRTLGLVGGNILLEGGALLAPSGRIELGSVAPNSLVNITPRDTAYSLSYEGINKFQDILLSQAALVGTSGNSGGAVQVQGKNITVTGGSSINANVTGNGVGQGLIVNTSESVQVIGENTQSNGISALRVQVSRTGTGKGGDMTINTPTLIVKDGAQISVGVFGTGKGGNLNVNASSKIQLTGTTVNGNFASGLFSETLTTGDAGNIGINTTELLIQDGARVNSSTRAFGQGGNINIGADTIEITGFSKNQQYRSFIGSETSLFDSSANAGDVTLSTRLLNIRNGALISSSTLNQGKGGNLTITARESINMAGTGIFPNGQVTRSGLFTTTSGLGAAGNIKIFDTGLIKVQGGGGIETSTFGQGRGGNIEVKADTIDLIGLSANGIFPSGLGSETTGINSSANAGNVTLSTRLLSIRDGALISTQTSNQGRGGDLSITARESINIAGTGTLSNGRVIQSGLFSTTSGSGAAGNIKISDTKLIQILNGGQVTASTLGQGTGGTIDVTADRIDLEGISSNQLFASELGSETSLFDSSANAGDVALTTKILNIGNGARISTESFNQGKAGNLTVSASESLNITGTGIENNNVVSSGLFTSTRNSGAAGNLRIFNTGFLKVQDGGRVAASSLGQGQGGSLEVNADTVEIVGISNNKLFGSFLGSETTGIDSSANAGNLTLTTRVLNIFDGALISTRTVNQGRGGDLNITARESINIAGTGTLFNGQSIRSGLITLTSGSGEAGNLKIFDTGIIKVQDGGGIETSTFGQGRAGNIKANADTIDLIGVSSNGTFPSFLGSETRNINSSANAGDVTLSTRLLNIRDGALISTQTFNQGRGGDLNVTARESINVDGTATLSNGRTIPSGLITLTSGSGTAGNLKIFDTGLVKIENGGAITASTFGQGSGGNINVTADIVDLVGLSENSIFSSFLGSETTGIDSNANAGNVTLTTRLLNIRDGALISTQTSNQGQAGNLTVSASESLNITGIGTQNNNAVSSGLFTSTRNSGAAGNLRIFNTGHLKVQDGGRVSTSTSGQGRSGNIDVTADTFDLIGFSAQGLLPSVLESETTGIGSSADAGNITLTTRLLNIRNGASISTRTFNQGKGGDLNVTARESINVAGSATLSNGQKIRSSLITLTSGSGAAGNLKIFDTGLVKIDNGGAITASTFGQGRGGNIDVIADSLELEGASKNELFLRSFLGSETIGISPNAKSGDVNISTRILNVRDGALISTDASNQGQGGNLTVTARESLNVLGTSTVTQNSSQLFYRSALSTQTKGSGAAGNLNITDTGQLVIANGAGIFASTSGQGNGGNIDITADRFDLKGISTNGRYRSFLASETTGIDSNANAGDIKITTRILNVNDGALISTETLNQGRGGNLTISARESMNFIGTTTLTESRFIRSGLSLQTRASGSAGNLRIFDTGAIQVKDGALISTISTAQGNAGNIDISADSLELLGFSTDKQFRSALSSQTIGQDSSANAGNITLKTINLSISDGAYISTETTNQGRGGNLTVTATESLRISGAFSFPEGGFWRSALSTLTQGSGEAGNLRIIDTGLIKIEEGAGVFASSIGQGKGGNVNVTADSIELRGISTDGQFLTFLGSETTGVNSRAEAGDVTITARNLNISNGALISTQTSNQGRGGNLTVTARESLNIFGTAAIDGKTFISGLFTSTSGLGAAGNIKIFETNRIVMNSGGQVSASSSGFGQGGNIEINADTVDLIGFSSNNQVVSAFTSETFGKDSIANAGDIKVTSRILNIRDGALISTQTSNQGRGGNLTVTARESLNIFGTAAINGNTSISGLFTSTSGLGAAGNIKIFETNRIVMNSGGQVSASSSGFGQGGNIEIKADTVDLIGFSSNNQVVSAFTSETFGKDSIANAGDIRVTSRILNIRDGARISTQTFNQGRGGNLTINAHESLDIVGTGIQNEQVVGSGLFTRTASFGAAGNIKIFDTELLTIKDGGQIAASTFGQGQGGNIEINAGNIDIFGISSNGQFISAVGSETNGANSSADAGDVTLRARNLNIRDRGLISTISFNQGKAGNININVDKSFNLTNGNILTFSRQSSGGSVNANAERIRLFGDSNISTFVVNGAGGGGDIKLTANSILAFGDSDIFAFAQDGKGGNITFNTPAFFGQNYRPAPPGTNPLTLEENNRVDINASAAVSGVIVLPDTSFVKNNLDELPEDAINTNALIANSCIARRNQQNGSFFVTGSGGLPARPSDAPLPSYSTGDVQPVPTEETTKLSTQKRRWQIGDPVIEPSGVYELPNGKLVLGKEC